MIYTKMILSAFLIFIIQNSLAWEASKEVTRSYIDKHITKRIFPSVTYKMIKIDKNDDHNVRFYLLTLKKYPLDVLIIVPLNSYFNKRYIDYLVDYAYTEVEYQKKSFQELGINFPDKMRKKKTWFNYNTKEEQIAVFPKLKFVINLTRLNASPKNSITGLFYNTNTLKKELDYSKYAPGLFFFSREVAGHEFGHAVVDQYFQEGTPGYSNFYKAVHEGMADYYSWLINGRSDDHLRRLKIHRGTHDFESNKSCEDARVCATFDSVRKQHHLEVCIRSMNLRDFI